MQKLYNCVEGYQCFANAELPDFCIWLDGAGPDDYTLTLILEDVRVPGSAVLMKQGVRYDEDENKGFSVHLGYEDTATLCGLYRMHFVLKDGEGALYRELISSITFLPVPEVGV